MGNTFIIDENAVESVHGITYEFPYTFIEVDFTDYYVPWHWHEEIDFDYLVEGSLTIETLTNSYTVHAGDAYFINTNIMNTKRKVKGTSAVIEHAHIFHPTLLTGHFRSLYEMKYLNPIMKNRNLEVVILRGNTDIGKSFLNILHTLTKIQAEENQEFQIRNLLSQGWLLLMEEIKIQQENHPKPTAYGSQRMKSLLNYIHRHYGEKITVADLAAHIGTSEKECIRSFKNTFHRTPIDYLVEYRIEQAKRLLKETDTSITEIVFLCGFQNSAYFAKTFKKFTTITPSEYRKKRLKQ